MVALAYLDMGQPAGRENHCRQQVGFFLMIMYGVAKFYRSNKAAQSFTNHKFFLCHQKPLGKPEKSNETRFPRFVFFSRNPGLCGGFGQTRHAPNLLPARPDQQRYVLDGRPNPGFSDGSRSIALQSYAALHC
jgi:hypothetical protein